MNLKTILDVISYIVVIGLGAYQIYKSVKRLIDHVNGRKEFLALNKEALDEAFLEHKVWAAIYAAGAIGMFVGSVYFFGTKGDYLYSAAMIAMGLIFTGFVLDCFVARRSWYYEDGFFFEYKYYRYRSLATVAPKKGIFPAYEVRFHASPDMVVTKKMGEKLMEKEAEWKRNRKEKKKAGNK